MNRSGIVGHMELAPMSYWGAVLKRGYKDAREAIQHHWVKTVLGGLLVAIGAGLFGYLEGGIEGWKKVEWWLCTAAAELLLLLIVFIWQFLAAPKRLQEEAVAAADETIKNLSHQLDEARIEIGQLRASMNEKESVFAAEKRALEAEIVRVRNIDPGRNIMRAELRRFIERFRTFMADISKGQRKNPLDLAGIESEANSYLKRHFPEYTHFTDDYPIAQSSSGGAILQPHQGLSQCEARIRRLEEVLALME